MTNGDKIRQMSDEELSEMMLFLMIHVTYCLKEELGGPGPLFCECDSQCVVCATKWLQEEVQEDE